MRGTDARSCWACWNKVDAPQCTHFAPVSRLPKLVLELVEAQEVCPVLCTSCLLAGVNLGRVDAQEATRALPRAPGL